jgi:hypothetical protein
VPSDRVQSEESGYDMSMSIGVFNGGRCRYYGGVGYGVLVCLMLPMDEGRAWRRENGGGSV